MEAYRPIEGATAFTITAQYRFASCQRGFQETLGTEMAIMRHIYNVKTVKTRTILDLQTAYSFVHMGHAS